MTNRIPHPLDQDPSWRNWDPQTTLDLLTRLIDQKGLPAVAASMAHYMATQSRWQDAAWVADMLANHLTKIDNMEIAP
jgi:hypothetical protein